MEQHLPNDRIRILKVQPGNLRQSHLYVRGHYDFFPSECIGPSRKKNRKTGCQIEILLDGLDETVRTDLCTDAETGKPRGMFRGRTWVRRFYEYHGTQAGDDLALERLDCRRYRLSVAPANGNGNGRAFTAAEFFAGIGLVRIAFENQGWQVLFANDIDDDKAKMLYDCCAEDFRACTPAAILALRALATSWHCLKSAIAFVHKFQ